MMIKGKKLATSASWKKGQSGNPKGKPPASFSVDEFLKALRDVEKSKRRSLAKHLIEQAYEDNRVLLGVANKLLPDLTKLEAGETLSGILATLYQAALDQQVGIPRPPSKESKDE